jgi:hypothetical protein
MNLALVLELLHVFAVFWFVAGLLGRAMAQAQARRATELGDLESVMRVSSLFELRMVRPGSLLLLAAGLLTAYLKGWPILGPLSGHPPYWVFASLVVFLTPFTLVPLVFIPPARCSAPRWWRRTSTAPSLPASPTPCAIESWRSRTDGSGSWSC